MVPIKGPAVPVPDDAIMASCVGTAFCAALQCTCLGLFGLLYLIYKDTMYRSFTPELFWSNTSIVVSLFLWTCPLVSQHTVADKADYWRSSLTFPYSPKYHWRSIDGLTPFIPVTSAFPADGPLLRRAEANCRQDSRRRRDIRIYTTCNYISSSIY